MSSDPMHPRGQFGTFIPSSHSSPRVRLTQAYSLDLIRSRGLLIDVLKALGMQREALTVIGAHAVLEQTRSLDQYLVSDSTRDADLGVSPSLLVAQPLLAEALDSLGLEEAHPDRPGVWGLASERERDIHDRLTVDLIAPASLAGSGRRAAQVGSHGSRSVSKTSGTELTTVDRSMTWVSKLDTSDGVDAYVAGHAALLCAKAYKLYDRLDDRELRRNRERLRTKDAGDIYRLMATSDPVGVRETFDSGEARSDISAAVRLGRERLLSIQEQLIDLTRRHFRDVLPESVVQEAMTEWLARFEAGR